MKVIFILFVSLTFIPGCSSTGKVTGNDKKMEVTDATFKRWTEPPRAGSDIPEQGTDLAVTVRNWPEGYVPQYIVRSNRKSFPATISDRSNNRVVIRGRIIRMSGLLTQKSERADLTDRLVFTDAEGKTRHIEISSWKPEKDEN